MLGAWRTLPTKRAVIFGRSASGLELRFEAWKLRIAPPIFRLSRETGLGGLGSVSWGRGLREPPIQGRFRERNFRGPYQVILYRVGRHATVR